MKNMRAVNLPFDFTKTRPTNKDFPKKTWIFLHGLLKNRMTFKPLISEIKTRDLEIYSLDSRNHNGAPHTKEHSVELITEDLLTFIQTNNLEKVNILGHSLGGKTGIEASLKHPELIESLFIIDIAPIDYFNSANQDIQSVLNRWQLLCENLAKIDLRGKNFQTVENEISELVSGNKRIVEDVIQHLDFTEENNVRWLTNVESIAENFPVLRTHVPPKDLQFEGNVKVMASLDSHYIEEKHLELYQGLFPNFEEEDLVFVEGDHYFHENQPELVARVFDEFNCELNNE